MCDTSQTASLDVCGGAYRGPNDIAFTAHTLGRTTDEPVQRAQRRVAAGATPDRPVVPPPVNFVGCPAAWEFIRRFGYHLDTSCADFDDFCCFHSFGILDQ